MKLSTQHSPLTTHHSPTRPAFTLLELLLAAVIGVLLMSALYVALNVQLRHAQAGRDLIEQSLLSRALLSRMADDIKASIGPSAPSLSSSSSTTTTTSTTGSTSSTSSTSSTTSGSTTGGSSSPTTSTNPWQLGLGVQGDSRQLVLYLSRLPQPSGRKSESERTAAVSDWRRVTYWLAGGAGEPLGLARQEVEQVTADQTLLETPASNDESAYVIAEEVKGLEFRYFDGNSWLEEWDGNALGPDGVTPLGPPLAISIRLSIVAGNGDPLRLGDRTVKSYRHVVAIPAAAGATSAVQEILLP